MGQYHKIADQTLEALQDQMEAIIEEADDTITNGEDWDVEAAVSQRFALGPVFPASPETDKKL